MPAIRGLADSDHSALLRVNADNWPAVARLDAIELRRLAALSNQHLVAVDGQEKLLGYLLAFDSGDAYDGEEFRHLAGMLRRRYLYVDQVAVAASDRRRGVAQALYAAVATQAAMRQIGMLCCEVNLDPPNPGSMAFHQRMGFDQIATMAVSDGRAVALLTRETAGIDSRRG